MEIIIFNEITKTQNDKSNENSLKEVGLIEKWSGILVTRDREEQRGRGKIR
jgi:hypothetical protein